MKFPSNDPPCDSSDGPRDLPGFSQWLAAEPPSARPDLVADLLGEFERPPVATLPARRRGFAVHLLAAAALVLFCVRMRSMDVPPSPIDTRLSADLVLMEARIDRLRDELHRLRTPWMDSPLAIEPDPTIDDPIQRLGRADPGLLRVVTARQSEERDPERAEREYLDLLRTYPDGPAAIVARERLVALAR